ncbi:DksA/TraR family C4-type zinc finger protein [Marinomonas sp. UCMA 3892]|jgi:phage/conjugal plasmid C-4 type zinc finger TraR family protein|uniref:Transcriptional regulator, TraR/DksA family n=1 Tax=Marinomonas sp. (strain MWYL1) TaxID=400668 RepID=A6VUG7_MARMS|nr:DksA/TraR family C4-type zinc finger protein [Marinomonas sp. UCMA 3892]NLU99536.1 DksA/TraR family C4-type zinc finger protein [Marinomonas sp. UCMA 3892]
MASGWAQDGAVQDQIDATVDSEVERAKNSMPKGESLTHCEECDAVIPEPRRKAIQGVRLCIQCQSELEKKGRTALYNRAGSKDSQLR